MAKPFDITTKQIVDADPSAWVKFLSLPGTSAELLDTDLSTSVQADRLIRVRNPDYILNTELLATYKPITVESLLHYNIVARYKYKLMVKTAAVLLRPEADGPTMSGVLRDETIDFRFQGVRMWNIPCETLLLGPLTLLPLAAISQVKPDEIPKVLGDIRDRTQTENPEMMPAIFSAAVTLLGLSYSPEHMRELVKGVWNMQEWMRESSIVQEIMAEGEARGEAIGEAKGEVKGKEEILSLQLHQRFSTLPVHITASLDQLTREQMNALAVALLNFTSLADLESWLQLAD